MFEVRVKGPVDVFAAALSAAGMEWHESDADFMRVFVPGDGREAGDDQRRICQVAEACHVQVRHLRSSVPTLGVWVPL